MFTYQIRKVLPFAFLDINVNLFTYFLHLSSSLRVLLFRNAIYSSFFFLQLFFNRIVIHGLSTKFLFLLYYNDWTTLAEQVVYYLNKIIIKQC